ncbi:hypothetical protein HC031_17945 [Planosporangium thailandense]|uniref:Uncharacterized protein n=1 Tax=Planosporangium thailandense TaxID=765197 RepID=A0ABX0Y098_9ACTN|nr:hypothetical protein [Planosporangium thailandense]NJC71587.1 hypothetical protein [Planosporangium thailandense]
MSLISLSGSRYPVAAAHAGGRLRAAGAPGTGQRAYVPRVADKPAADKPAAD